MKKTLIAALALTLGWAPAYSIEDDTEEDAVIAPRCNKTLLDKIIAAHPSFAALSAEEKTNYLQTDKLKFRTDLCVDEVWDFIEQQGPAAPDHNNIMSRWNAKADARGHAALLYSLITTYEEIDNAVAGVYEAADPIYQAGIDLGLVTKEEENGIVKLTFTGDPILDPATLATVDDIETHRDRILGLVKYAKGDAHNDMGNQIWGGGLLVAFYNKTLILRDAVNKAKTDWNLPGTLEVSDIPATEDFIRMGHARMAIIALAYDPNDAGTELSLPDHPAARQEGWMTKIDWGQFGRLARHNENISDILIRIDELFPNGMGTLEGVIAERIRGVDSAQREVQASQQRFAQSVLDEYKSRMAGLTNDQIFDGSGLRHEGDLTPDQSSELDIIRAEYANARIVVDGDDHWIVTGEGTDTKRLKKIVIPPTLGDKSAEEIAASVTSTAEAISRDIIAGDEFKGKLRALGYAVAGPSDDDEETLPPIEDEADQDPEAQKRMDDLAKCNSPADLLRTREQRIRDELISEAQGLSGENSELRADIQEVLNTCIRSSRDQLTSDEAAIDNEPPDPGLSADAIATSTAAAKADALRRHQDRLYRTGDPLGCWPVAKAAVAGLAKTVQDQDDVVDAAHKADSDLYYEFTRNVKRKTEELHQRYMSTDESSGLLPGLSAATRWSMNFLLKHRDGDKSHIDAYFETRLTPGGVANCVARLGFELPSKERLRKNFAAINDKPDWKEISSSNINRYCDVCTLDGENNRCGGNKGDGTLVKFILDQAGGGSGSPGAPTDEFDSEAAEEMRREIESRLPTRPGS